MLTLVEEGPELGQCGHKGVCVSAEGKSPESPEILTGSCAPTQRLMCYSKCLSPGDRWERRRWNRIWWRRHGWMDGWMGRLGRCIHRREFPLKERETLSWETVFLETPPEPSSPPHPSYGLPGFWDAGNFLRPLHPRWGHFRFCRNSRRLRGGGVENRGGGVPGASSQHAGDLSFLPSRSGNTASSSSSSAWPLSPRGEEEVHFQGPRALPLAESTSLLSREIRLGTFGGNPGAQHCQELRLPQRCWPRLVPEDPAHFLGGRAWGGARAEGVTTLAVPAPVLRRWVLVSPWFFCLCAVSSGAAC